MGPRSSRGVTVDEFPILKENGLVIHKIEADGNCLFRALSDQLYGHSEDHLKIRRDIVEQMRANPDEYKPYFAVGFVKRNAGRKAARTGPVDSQAASDAELEEKFQAYLVKMSRPHTWSDETELKAFVQEYKVDVTVWYPSWKLTFSAEHDKTPQVQVQITFNENASHYSSVRDASSDHPAVKYVKATTEEKSEINKSVAISAADDAAKKLLETQTQASPVTSTSSSISSAADTSNKKRKSDAGNTREDDSMKRVKRRNVKPVKKGLSQQRKKLIELAKTPFVA
ncbi:hypothetical protein DID88_005265 [Monilinia fructigena]|uniref:OTU domain-containing protein n=1 Tax=Monilinia fructigena TaxID=38457 RepID=A0A395IZK9_9HELO|nr:hypothetical protein DID88_005263 [Monilinia fructigena]RAL65593.1 hypothetical protein DID88_005265 [Monilinia fructigena]